ncbi:hypothetical protein RWE15_12555 [Virgibacillus halophilus]|uniref:Uncharacterized protein n=1 Tax=Tigheibacillus halophilus TaxID=361280 RepID=A0ABU5C711_9BACI|nr:hypothetical protein [Virgibacillus halophilus]
MKKSLLERLQYIRQVKTCSLIWRKAVSFFDAIMFSGGEFLISPLDEICELLQKVRRIFTGKIIITTSGIYQKKIEKVYSGNLTDGVHIDMKLPYHVLDVVEDKQIYQDIMGITPTKKMVDNLLCSVEMVIAHNSILDQVRTVKYPILGDAFFEEIRRYVDELKARYQSNVPYFLNEFLMA